MKCPHCGKEVLVSSTHKLAKPEEKAKAKIKAKTGKGKKQ